MNSTRNKIPFWSNLCRTYGYPSSSKFLAVSGGLASLATLLIVTWRGFVPEYLPELVGAVLFALVLGRGASKFTNAWEQSKKGVNDDVGQSDLASPSVLSRTSDKRVATQARVEASQPSQREFHFPE